MKKVLVVGAGLYGATIANLLSEHCRVSVIDKAKEIGGSCATGVIEGIHVHKFGPHIFHTNNESVWKFVNKFATFKEFYNEPLASYNGRVYNLPFNMNTFSRLFDIQYPFEAEHKIKKDLIKFDEPKNLKEYALSTVGKKVYTTLIKDYTEKQWGRKCEELPADFIKRLPVRFNYNNHYFDDKYQGIPTKGYSDMINMMLKGIDVRLNTAFTKSMEKEFDLIVYSGSIDEYYDYKYGKLEYRSLTFSHSVFNEKNHQGVAVMNYTDNSPFTRIIEHKHFLNEQSNKTVVTTETPCEWDGTNERYYPIQLDNNKRLYRVYKSIKNRNVIFGGRLSSYQYLNMDKVIEMAFNDYNEIRNSWK